MNSEYEKRLTSGLESLGITLSGEQIARQIEFLQLMQKWNRTFNLTAIRSIETAINLHLIDSLTILPHIHGQSVLDVGTGAGLPGIPLAIARSNLEFILLDSNIKKTRFVQQAIIELDIKNVHVVTSRIEDFKSHLGFDSIVVRAFASLPEILNKCSGLLNPGGRILAQKGQLPLEEIESLETSSVRIHRLEIPEIMAERHLIELMVG